jgi:hypothetical protein
VVPLTSRKVHPPLSSVKLNYVIQILSCAIDNASNSPFAIIFIVAPSSIAASHYWSCKRWARYPAACSKCAYPIVRVKSSNKLLRRNTLFRTANNEPYLTFRHNHCCQCIECYQDKLLRWYGI